MTDDERADGPETGEPDNSEPCPRCHGRMFRAQSERDLILCCPSCGEMITYKDDAPEFYDPQEPYDEWFEDELDFQDCPNCGSDGLYDGNDGYLYCESCGAVFEDCGDDGSTRNGFHEAPDADAARSLAARLVALLNESDD